MKRISIAMLATVAGLYGCATTDSNEEAKATTSGATPTSSVSQSSGIAPGTPRPPVPQGRRGGTTADGQSDLKRSVYFEFDKYDVKPEYRALVESHARWLKANPGARLTVEGNADEQGSREYNLALGQRRAESVTKMLTLMGAKPEQIEAISYGEERPRASGHDEKAWTENRRSDFAAR